MLAEEERLKERDLSREEVERTGDLSIKSRNEFLAKTITQNYFLYTDHLDIKETVNVIKTEDKFFV